MNGSDYKTILIKLKKISFESILKYWLLCFCLAHKPIHKPLRLELDQIGVGLAYA